MPAQSKAVTFDGERNELSGTLHLPEGESKAGVVLAHCFTCSKSYKVIRHLAEGIAGGGYSVLRFDFTGLGESEGDFGETSLTTNVADLEAAATFLRESGGEPCAMAGHSLGGAATLLAASRQPDIAAVAVIASPATANHVRGVFSEQDVEAAMQKGRVRVEIAGRPFDISAEFFQDLQRHHTLDHVTDLGRPLLVIHSTADRIVSIEEGEKIFGAARQPRWFAAVPGANHLFSDTEHAAKAARVLVDFFDTVLV